jgi:hypothetical protein
MYRTGDMFNVKGERLILKDDTEKTTLLFHAQHYNQYISKYEFGRMIESGEATLVRHIVGEE